MVSKPGPRQIRPARKSKRPTKPRPTPTSLAMQRKPNWVGIAAGANQITPYKIGNIYRAAAAGTIPTKPANTEGTATEAGITVAPVGWQLTRPDATSDLPHVYDCHVYGYSINGAFGIQYGTPNRTDRYNPFTATLLAKLDEYRGWCDH